MLKDPLQKEGSQRLLVLFILWNLYSKYRDCPIEEDRLRKAFAFAVPVLVRHGINLDLYFSFGTRGFPVLDHFLAEALRHHLIREENGVMEGHFRFKADAGRTLMSLYDYPPHEELLILEEAAEDVLMAFENGADMTPSFYPTVGQTA